MAHSIEVVEVGMRDGFQMESLVLPTDEKIAIARQIIKSGIRTLEATSFVSPALVPQLADASEVVRRVKELGANVRALVPNSKGALRAADAGVDAMVLFVSASETHNRANIRRTIEQSLEELCRVTEIGASADIQVRCSIATAFGCPFEGYVPPESVLRIADHARRLGITGITLGDTTGMATPLIVNSLCDAFGANMPTVNLALHFHNTRGLGLVNVKAGLDKGIREFESAIGGLGGCPFAIGATGNVCTEDLVYMLDELHLSSGVDVRELVKASQAVEALVGRELPGQIMKAGPRLENDSDKIENSVDGAAVGDRRTTSIGDSVR